MHATLLGQQHVQFAHQLHQGHNFGLLAALLCALGLNSITNCALRFQIAMVLIKRCNIVPPRSRTHGASTPSFRSRSERTSLHDSVARLGIKENDKKKKEIVASTTCHNKLTSKCFGMQVCHAISSNCSHKMNIRWLSIYIR